MKDRKVKWDTDHARALRKLGWSWNRIAKELGMSPTAVHHWFHSKPERLRGAPMRITEMWDTRRVHDLKYVEGWTWPEIAKETGVRELTLRQYFRRARIRARENDLPLREVV